MIDHSKIFQNKYINTEIEENTEVGRETIYISHIFKHKNNFGSQKLKENFGSLIEV